MRAASVFYHGMFNFVPYTLPEVVINKCEITEETNFNTNLKRFMGDSDILCNTIVVNNQEYLTGNLLVLQVTDADNIIVGIVQAILIKKDKVYFVIQKFKATRKFLQYFESEVSGDTISEFIESNKIADYKPLIKRGTLKKFLFVLHHHISYQYD